ncbi:MAG: BREX-2 system adenine-specific DNA-methyltransferase PglX [Kineosporiaceae bacterium]
MTATAALTTDLQRQVLDLEHDLRDRIDADARLSDSWRGEHATALARRRTAASWEAWRDDRVTQAAVAWVLASVFIRFCEDNALVRPVWIGGFGRDQVGLLRRDRKQEALDAQLAYFRQHPEHTDREWLEHAIDHLRGLKATAQLFDGHAALCWVSPSGQAVTALLDFWRQRRDDGTLVHDLRDDSLSTRFLGDLYQDLSKHAKQTYALLQTPEFVEEFILDQTLRPALTERPLDGFRMIDPTCGSGHFLLGAFAALIDRWYREAPGMDARARVQLALDAVHGVDLNPFAVAIARFRLTVAALKECQVNRVEEAPAFTMHLAVGDSLLHGATQTLLGDTDLSGFTYATEDLAALQTILSSGRYDVVVGNPPYITVKDKSLNAAYRQRYSTCKGKYALSVPFMQRFFDLAKKTDRGRPSGWVGQITSNSFMKREFGISLVEEFLPRMDLRLVADTSGAYIPGHGTPTVIIIGRQQPPVRSTVRAILGVRGEPGRPENPAKGIVWSSIVEHVEDPGWNDGWITVTNLDRRLLATHPWSLSGGGALEATSAIEDGGMHLSSRTHRIGVFGMTNADDAMLAPLMAWQRTIRDTALVRTLVLGDEIRDWVIDNSTHVFFPYDDALSPVSTEALAPYLPWIWPCRTTMGNRATFWVIEVDRGWCLRTLPAW